MSGFFGMDDDNGLCISDFKEGININIILENGKTLSGKVIKKLWIKHTP